MKSDTFKIQTWGTELIFYDDIHDVSELSNNYNKDWQPVNFISNDSKSQNHERERFAFWFLIENNHFTKINMLFDKHV